MTARADIAKRTIDSAAQDGYCPIWEVVDEVAQACKIARHEAIHIVRRLGDKLVASGQFSFWSSFEPYGHPTAVDPSHFFGDGLTSHSRLADGPPYYYLHKSPRSH